MNEFFLIAKTTWETWQAANDPDLVYSASLTPDQMFYLVDVKKNNSEQKQQLEGIPGARKYTMDALFPFREDNVDMFTEPGDGVSPPARGFMAHPLSTLYEIEALYDGTNATMNFSAVTDSTWDIPKNCLPTGDANSIMEADDMLWLKISKFSYPPGANATRYVYIDEQTVYLHVHPIVSVVDNGTYFTITLTIPPTP